MGRRINEILADLDNVGSVDENNIERFEELIQEAMKENQYDAIVPLLRYLDDDCEFDEVMFGIVHGLESFPRKDYFAVLSSQLLKVLVNSPRWGSILITRIMNSESDYAHFLSRLSQEDGETKSVATDLMRSLSSKERFRNQCEKGIRVLSE